MKAYVGRVLTPSELISLDEHLALCADCRRTLSAYLSDNTTHARSQLQSDELEHPDYNDLESYVDNSCDEIDREIVESHLQLCSDCYADVREMQAFRNQAEAAGAPSINKIIVPFRPFPRVFRYTALAAAAVIIVLILNITREPGAPNAAKSTAAPSREKQGAPQKTMPSGERLLASLQDQGTTISIDVNGKLTGAEQFPQDYQQMTKAVLMSQKLAIPAEVRDLAGDSRALLGDSGTGAPFELMAPVGIVVESTRPHFEWEPLAGAKQYQVHVYDQKFHPVATSGMISGTSWTPDRDLARSKVYVWSVIALKDGQEIESPAPPSPEAHFKVLDASKLQEIRAFRDAGSHLLLGLACTNAGLIPEAQREFQILLEQNPDSQIAKSLLGNLVVKGSD